MTIIKKTKTKIIKTEIKKSDIKSKIINIFEIPVIDRNNKVVSHYELNKLVWGVQASPALISFVVIAEQAAQRQGTKKVKDRGEVSGGGRKPWKQKGTGRARAGSIRSPIWCGGGITFGPTGKENYIKKVNKKVHHKAILGCLNQILINNKLIILKGFKMEIPSTSEIKKITSELNVFDKKTLFVIEKKYKNFILSLRNIKNFKIVEENNITVFDLLNSKKVIILEELMNKIEEKLIK